MSAAATFGGFTADAFRFFAELAADNSREFFQANRERFEREVREPLEAMFLELREEFGGELKLFRQNRDVRFSRDKSPYKTNTYGVLRNPGGTDQGLYASLAAGGLWAGSGYYQLARDQLDRFRAAAADDRHGPALEQAVAAAGRAGLDVTPAALKTAPRGYPADHPRIELLRRTSLTAVGQIAPDADGLPRPAALDHVGGAWRSTAPLRAWLDEHVGPSRDR